MSRSRHVSQLSRLALVALVAAWVVSLAPSMTPLVRAADVPTATALTSVPDPHYFGTNGTYVAQVAPSESAGFVRFRYSTNGLDWVTFASATVVDGTASAVYHLFTNSFTGIRQVRAEFVPDPGFLASTSTEVDQYVGPHPVALTNLRLINRDAGDWNAPVLPTSNLTLRVEINAGEGAVVFERLVGESWVELGTSGIIYTVPYSASIDTGPLGAGSHTLRARYTGSPGVAAGSSEKVFQIDKAVPTLQLASEQTVQANHAIAAYAAAGGTGGSPTGTISVLRLPARTVVATGAASGFEFTIPALPIGVHDFVVTYGGDANFQAGESDAWTITVIPDTVQATSVGVQYTSFYPYTDGYRDTVKVSGNRQEPISVSIRIYSPTGSAVRGATVTRATGAYAYAWNGRNTAGTILAAGKYKVVQTLTDAAGTRKVVTSYVSLSQKRLVTKTSYVTKKGYAVNAKGDPGGGSITLSSTAGTAKLVGKYPTGWVGVGYQFALPAATVYKSITFQIYAKAPMTAPTNSIGMQNFKTCAYSSTAAWNEDCFDRWKGFGSSSTSATWFSTTGSISTNVYGRTARGMVSVNTSTVTIYSARVKVVYGVLQ